MLSKASRRPQKFAGEAYVCLSCQLRAQQQRKSSTRPRRRSSRDAIDGASNEDKRTARKTGTTGEASFRLSASNTCAENTLNEPADAAATTMTSGSSPGFRIRRGAARFAHLDATRREHQAQTGPLVRKHFNETDGFHGEAVSAAPIVRKYGSNSSKYRLSTPRPRSDAAMEQIKSQASAVEDSLNSLLVAHAAGGGRLATREAHGDATPPGGPMSQHDAHPAPSSELSQTTSADNSWLDEILNQPRARFPSAAHTASVTGSAVSPMSPHTGSQTLQASPTSRWVWPGTLGRGVVWLREHMGRGPRSEVRLYHTSARRFQQAEAVASQSSSFRPPPFASRPSIINDPNSIRGQLRQWQEEHGKEMEHLYKDDTLVDRSDDSDTANNLTRLGDVSGVHQRSQDDDDERQAMAMFSNASAEDLEDNVTDPRFLHMGDLVELEFPTSEKESIIAVFVRRMGTESQFYTMQGRWTVLPERHVQYSIPGWVSPEMVEPLLAYLPNEADMEDMEALRKEAWINDLSIPRDVAAPLVSRMVAFHEESLEVYRKHASVLDNAHQLLAHDTDLRYGSLSTAATMLLKKPPSHLPLTALFTVRKALMHAGFAFNVDRRSHRLTGYLQIRSKEQVRMVEQVRMWLREWQDDLALVASLSEAKRKKHVPNRGAKIVYAFVNKTRKIVENSRTQREPTMHGSIGPSKVKRAITPEQDSVRTTLDFSFTAEDQELIRFIEAWACNNMFLGLPRISALPPLILTATGLYDGYAMKMETGFVFLQEIGTIMPYENRVRFDQHLLLPSSQHSKPLQNLMSKLLTMSDKPELEDSMKDLRRDWGSLPVYCIDAASAHEIDDGLSIERANHADAINPEWWVHVHIANPTAHFDRSHPLAKMARHMGESIYMPERAYMMLPRWATSRHFSLAKDRPCLTFSARMNEKGETLEKKIQSGRMSNVHRLTPDEVNELLGMDRRYTTEELTLTVGGDPPPGRPSKSAVPDMKETNVRDLQMLQNLAVKRQALRKAAGGVFFNNHASEVNVWQSWKNPGLTWDHPHRKGSRVVEGDPVIQMKARGLTNWFTAGNSVIDILVQEMMLLACEVSTAWCAERKIPTIYRGSVAKPNMRSSESFYREVCEPPMARNNGEIPLHIGIEYIRHQGSVILNTKPLHHKMLGLPHYGKVTSPLRRYGDMILHWQIEAALREEARLGRSLIPSPDENLEDRDLSFLPFSEAVLKTIILGLQPREVMITRAKKRAESFWQSLLLFRAHHFGEAALPFEKVHGYVAQAPRTHGPGGVLVMLEELNLQAAMNYPNHERDRETGRTKGLPQARLGDRWECVIDHVDVFARQTVLRPLRLIERFE